MTAVSGATPSIMAARSNCVRRSERRRHTSCGLISPHAAAIINELQAHPFPERPRSAHAAQLADCIGALPEAA
jgi:hypothetical protein